MNQITTKASGFMKKLITILVSLIIVMYLSSFLLYAPNSSVSSFSINVPDHKESPFVVNAIHCSNTGDIEMIFVIPERHRERIVFQFNFKYGTGLLGLGREAYHRLIINGKDVTEKFNSDNNFVFFQGPDQFSMIHINGMNIEEFDTMVERIHLVIRMKGDFINALPSESQPQP